MDTNELGKITEYIEANERTREMLMQILLGNNRPQENITEEDKIRVAYALNMCTVSVSQIVDYKDLNILDQEYDAILNNINLEQMPKDTALLSILRQLLDTITYFKIEAGEKEMIEREYQQKMKNAIWSAVPNFGLLVAGGSPLTMGISLASQIGIGYMNYRRNKAECVAENERKMWQLQRSAIEQFNGLRRELFDTAWRLADVYNFPDGYRLTEKQITQYNKILMDQDEIRKYERLDSIKCHFEAYPPFWYFMGNSANYIAGDKNLKLSEDTREKYRNIALECFEKFERLNVYNILREDQLVAACALEHIDLLLLNHSSDDEKIIHLLEQAVSAAGNAYDILEMCAITYLKIGRQSEAGKLLRVLVNEDYNKIINAQLLSSIYVAQRQRADYELLTTRVDEEYLFPMPKEDGSDLAVLEDMFGAKQKEVLKQKCWMVLEEYFEKYCIRWNKITSIFDVSDNYPDSFFVESKKAQIDRESTVRTVYADLRKKESYQRRMKESNYALTLLMVLNDFCKGLFDSSLFGDLLLNEDVEASIKNKIVQYKEDINEIQEKMREGQFPVNAYLYSQKITFGEMVNQALIDVKHYIFEKISQANVNEISIMESELVAFCRDNDLTTPEVIVNRGTGKGELFVTNNEIFGPELFGHQAVLAKKNMEFMINMMSFVKEKMNSMDLLGGGVTIYFNDSSDFDTYFYNIAFEEHPDIKNRAIMVLKDNTEQMQDLIFTTEGIVNVVKDKVKFLTPYKEVKIKSDAIILYRKNYNNPSVDLNQLFSLIRDLKNRFIKDISEKMEFISETVNVKLLNQWFKEREECMQEGVVRIYAIPTTDVMNSIGYQMEYELDEEHHLLQFCCEESSGEIIDFRIVQFENIESNFQAYLLEQNGLIKIK